jgi:hypothetical protein
MGQAPAVHAIWRRVVVCDRLGAMRKVAKTPKAKAAKRAISPQLKMLLAKAHADIAARRTVSLEFGLRRLKIGT